MEKMRHYTKEIILFLLTLGLYYFLKDAGSLKYMILLAATAVCGIYGIKNLKREYFVLGIPSAVYVLFGLITAVFEVNFSFQMIKEIAFAVIPLISAIGFFVAFQKLGTDFIKCQYWAMILLTLTWIKYYYIEDIFESQYAFAFGVFLLYFCMIKKDWKYILLTTFAMYFMNKRIAMLSAVLILVAYDLILYLIQKKPEWKKKIPQIISCSVFVICFAYVIFLCVTNLKGQFLQDLTSGRSVAWAAVKEEYGLSVLWLGKGLGDVVNMLGRLQIPDYVNNLHNDLLKVFIETGFVGYGIWLVSHFVVCYGLSKKQNLSFEKQLFLYLTMAYSLFNYATDNILVYVNYWFPVYFVILITAFPEKIEKKEEHIDYKREHKLLLGVILVIGLCLIGNVIYVYIDYRNPSEFTIPEEAAEIYSPQGISRVSVWTRDGQPYYRVRHGGVTLIEPSILGVESKNQKLEKDVVIEEIIYQDIVEVEEAVKDENNPIKEAYQPVLIKMQRDGFDVNLEVRVYDYGAAFRYVLPNGTENYEELTQLRFAEGSTIAGYDLNADSEVDNVSTEELEDICLSMPITVRFDTGEVLKIFETQESKNCTELVKVKWKRRTLSMLFQTENGKETPWRVFDVIEQQPDEEM